MCLAKIIFEGLSFSVNLVSFAEKQCLPGCDLLLYWLYLSKSVNAIPMEIQNKTHYEAPETAVLELTQERVICQQSADFTGLGGETEWNAVSISSIEFVEII